MYNFNSLYDFHSDEDTSDKLPLQDSCARTVVYAPKRARYFIVGLMSCFILVPDLFSLYHGSHLNGK